MMVMVSKGVLLLRIEDEKLFVQSTPVRKKPMVPRNHDSPYSEKEYLVGKEVILYAILRSKLPVAKATVISTNPNTLLGGEPLGRQFCEVVVNVVLQRDVMLPRPYGDIETMADALSISITWPYKKMKTKMTRMASSSCRGTDDQQVLRKRKTELGGTFSVASLILFLGLVTVLLYQVIRQRNVEVHRVKPANAPDLLSFVNDLEFHITTVSSMSCTQVLAPSTIAMGTPGFVDFRVVPLSTFLTYSCQNTSQGPSITLKCNGCRIPPTDHYVSWQFVDLPRQPASAVGF